MLNKNSSNRDYDIVIDEAGGDITYIPLGASIEGNIITSCTVIINGTLKGDIKSDNKILIGSQAEIFGNISASQLLIYGKVHGSVFVNDIIILKEKCIVESDIVTSKIICEKNCTISGHIHFASDGAVPPPKKQIYETVKTPAVTNDGSESGSVLKKWDFI